ncbi:Winged helix-turn-helix transcription repressor DNA-binding [Penicillium canescens]|uniref:Methylated-DNA--protein-cysteine methyltransferase n=1 Tax=Penicillium canescens TaxID=5083 RepID=A0AAD6I202_PENCN|nr:Winged helix-turn-helix transcription repressor DNA-binding [Penicillium canescens]KAJ6040606.1 Winged helix-turn-helix transcription repressor DNA-binding [Penicillium canescens]KAJ6101248.1 Winged helix-turn-helix transcription repressor DNA-binding [Penicillium canescens]
MAVPPVSQTAHLSSPSPPPSISSPAQKEIKKKTKEETKSPPPPEITPQTKKYLHRISLHPTLTPFRRRVYRTLLSVPPGRWTTYSAMAKYLGSSARAVGNAMRTNPFAPEVPCHRVLAADGRLGGYKGEWKVDGHKASGSFSEEKMVRLKEEGVDFVDGKVVGVCFLEFIDLGK